MKYLLLILLFPSLLEAQSKAISKDKTVEISTTDPNIILGYIGHSKVDEDPYRKGGADVDAIYQMNGKGYTFNKDRRSNKLDTLGGWHLVSDTSKGWNPVSAMYLYEIRANVYTRVVNGKVDVLPVPIVAHYKWLDSNHKLFYLKVWATQ